MKKIRHDMYVIEENIVIMRSLMTIGCEMKEL